MKSDKKNDNRRLIESILNGSTKTSDLISASYRQVIRKDSPPKFYKNNFEISQQTFVEETANSTGKIIVTRRIITSKEDLKGGKNLSSSY